MHKASWVPHFFRPKCFNWCNSVMRSLTHLIANTRLIDFYPASTIGSCLIHKLEKISDHRFQLKISPSSPSGNSELKPPHACGIPNCVSPPCLQNSSPRKPPSPSQFQDATHGRVWIFSGINKPSNGALRSKSKILPRSCFHS